MIHVLAAAAAAAASETHCLKSPSDWYPSSHPYQAIALIFHCGPCCFSLELSVFSELWRFSLFCTRFTRELQTVSYSLQGRKKAPGLILFIDCQCGAGCTQAFLASDFFFFVVFVSMSSICVRECTLKSRQRIKTFLSHSLIWLEQLPD